MCRPDDCVTVLAMSCVLNIGGFLLSSLVMNVSSIVMTHRSDMCTCVLLMNFIRDLATQFSSDLV